MKYADGPSVQAETLVEAPLDVIWSLVTDINVAAGFSTEFRGATWIDQPGLGARFRGRNGHAALGEWETVSFVSRYEPPHAFAWDVGDPEQPSASWCDHAAGHSFESRRRPTSDQPYRRSRTCPRARTRDQR